MTQNFNNVPIFPYGVTVGTTSSGTIAVGTSYIYALTVPTDAMGGGLTVNSFKVYTHGTVATNVMNVALVTMSSAAAVNGTVYNIASAAQWGGTSHTNTGTVVTSSWVDTDDSHVSLAVEVKQVAVLASGSTNMVAVVGWQQGRG
jgi:predicted heme/steroid binding protein